MNDANFEYAGFWLRVWAFALDSLLLIAVLLPMVVAVYGWAYFEPGAPSIRGPADLLITWLLPAVAVLLFWRYRRATPGKMAIRATIVDAGTGLPMEPRQALIRYVGYYLSALPLGLGLLWVAFDARKQGWHDKLAGTVVIRPRR